MHKKRVSNLSIDGSDYHGLSDPMSTFETVATTRMDFLMFPVECDRTAPSNRDSGMLGSS